MKNELPTQIKNELLQSAKQIYTNYLNRSRHPNKYPIQYSIYLEDSLDDKMCEMVRNNDDLDHIEKELIFKLIRHAIFQSPERCKVNNKTTNIELIQIVDNFITRLETLITDAFLEEETQDTRLELPAIYMQNPYANNNMPSGF